MLQPLPDALARTLVVSRQKIFLNLLSTLGHLPLFASLQAVQSEIPSKIKCVRLALISPWLTLPSSPTSIFMPHHAHLLSTYPGAGGDGCCCFICMVRHSLRFPAVADLVNFSPLVSNKAADSPSIWGCFQVSNKTLGGTPCLLAKFWSIIVGFLLHFS